MINKVILVGNLGQDPEVRTTGGGTPVCNLRIATTHRRKDRDGNWQDQTEWHSVVLFGRNAENAGRFLNKGRQVYVEGRLQTRKWQDRDGRDRWSTEVVGDEIKFLGSRGDRPADGGGGGGYRGGGGQGGGGYGGGQGGGGYGGGQGGGGYGGGQGGGGQGGGGQGGGGDQGGGVGQGGGGGGQGGGGGDMPYDGDSGGNAGGGGDDPIPF